VEPLLSGDAAFELPRDDIEIEPRILAQRRRVDRADRGEFAFGAGEIARGVERATPFELRFQRGIPAGVEAQPGGAFGIADQPVGENPIEQRVELRIAAAGCGGGGCGMRDGRQASSQGGDTGVAKKRAAIHRFTPPGLIIARG